MRCQRKQYRNHYRQVLYLTQRGRYPHEAKAKTDKNDVRGKESRFSHVQIFVFRLLSFAKPLLLINYYTNALIIYL